MQVTASSQTQFSRSASLRQIEVRESLSISRRGNASAPPAATDAPAPAASSDSEENRLLADPKYLNLLILRRFAEDVLGLTLDELLSADRPDASLAPDSPATDASTGNDVTFRYERSESRLEADSLEVGIRARLTLADGREIDGELNLSLSRTYAESSRVVVTNAPQRKDPLVLNLNGEAVSLLADRFAFDLKADGRPVDMPRLAAGNVMVVQDRNGNGRVDDGREVVGALSGDAWADLGAMVSDGNGFIDAGDPAYANLRLWAQAGDGERLRSLSEAGVMALSLQAVDSPYALKAGREELGMIRSTSYFVGEDLRLRPAQRIDITA